MFLLNKSISPSDIRGLESDNIDDELQGSTYLIASSHLTRGTSSDMRPFQHHEMCPIYPYQKDEYGMPPLLQAVSQGRTKSVRELCDDYEVDTLAKDVWGRTVLHIGAQQGGPALFSFLLHRSGVSVDAVDAGGKTPLFYAARHERAALLKCLLHLHDPSFDTQDRSGRTALSYACERNSYRALELLLEVGANSTLKDHTGMTPLHHAMKAGNFAVIKRLVKHTKNGNPALKLAGHMRRPVIEEKLLTIGKDVAKWTKSNLQNLLIQSARSGRDVIVRRLLHIHEVDADARDRNGRTPLSHASEMDHRNIVRILLRRNADRSLRDKRGRLPEDYARKSGCKRLLKSG